MPQATRRRDFAAMGASATFHVLFLALIATQVSRLAAPSDDPGPPLTMIPLILLPRLAAAETRAAPARPRPHPSAQRALPPEVQPRFAPPDTPAPSGAAEAAPSGTGLPNGVAAALRGRVGCAEGSGLSLTRAERGDCNERLGRGAGAAPFIRAPIDPQIRGYWDEVAKAKAPDGPPTPRFARGSLGVFSGDPVGMSGHGPGVGCHIGFGGGKLKVHRPAHGLKLGPLPCFIVPPAGSLTPDVDVQNPDQVLRHAPGA